MTTLRKLRWSYAFSYGKDNEIDFTKNELLQLVGKNGHGKSSICLILEEVLYNKNSKGTKRAKVLNRYAGAKAYTISLEFEVNGDEYVVSTNRGATQTVKLVMNGDDISAHTATATYKLIEEIIGIDHKTFTQIVYQSSAFSLEFLTATDTHRKKFLIDLLRLSRYSDALEHFKDRNKEVTKDLEVANTKLRLTSSILTKYSEADLVPKALLPNIPTNTEYVDELAALELQIKNIVSTNSKISSNNKYKELLSLIELDEVEMPQGDLLDWQVEQANLNSWITHYSKVISGTSVQTHCPSCKQAVDNSHKLVILNEAKAQLPVCKENLRLVSSRIMEYSKSKAKYDASVSAKLDWERYYSLIDKTLQSELLDKAILDLRKRELEALIQRNRADVMKRNNENQEIVSYNARVEVITAQLETARTESDVIRKDIEVLAARSTRLQILVKTFSTTGLVAYKIECLVKDLEDLANTYLQDMSDGRFQLAFKMSSSDKLDVIVTDNGTDVDICELSNGELARVNVSTLLAIRSTMQSLSNTRINLLMLDETIENLDIDGKEKLVEVLLKEENLNTVLISHGFTHPLLEKLVIVKENNISRIE